MTKTLNELEREKRDKIRQLSAEEVERYIDKLNKEMAEAWGNISNAFSIDINTMRKNSLLCDEAVDILNDKYKMELLVATSRLNTLAEKHSSDVEDVKHMILESSLNGLMSTYWQTSHNILILHQFLNILYDFYWTAPSIIENYINKTNVDDDTKNAIMEELEIDKIPVYEYYNQHFINVLEVNIKHMTNIIDDEMILLKRLIQFEFKEDEIISDEYYEDFREGMLEYQKLSQQMIAEYEDLKLDGFKPAKVMESEIVAETIDKDVKLLNEIFKDSRPSYNLNDFIFIPPKIHIESMTMNHPEWEYYDDNTDDSNHENEEEIDKYYVQVTNPTIYN